MSPVEPPIPEREHGHDPDWNPETIIEAVSPAVGKPDQQAGEAA